MNQDPFESPVCDRTVGALDALMNGVPDGSCLSLAVTPLGAFVGIAALGIFLACVRAVVLALWNGATDADRSRAAHEPDLSLREAANRARAERLAGHTE